MSEVVTLPVITRLDSKPERVLNKAIEVGLESAIVIGWDKSGAFYFASSEANGANVNWLMDVAKTKILANGGA